jgi:UDP-N-acetylmuramoyl-tripeptide--D-alanyl-D-alanine ligase
VGVAKALLAIEGSPEFGVFELGTNHPGEITVLSSIVQPHLSLITNVNPSHLEGFVDLAGVCREKLSLFDTTLPGGTLFVNADDPSLASYQPRADRRIVTFGIREKADYALYPVADRGFDGFDIVLRFPDAEVTTTTHLLGRHNLYNVLAASALSHAMGVPATRVAEAVRSFGAYKGRFNPVRSSKGYTVIDDSYNANPGSMKWAIDTLAGLPCTGKRIAALGGMKELGENAERYHRDLGRALRDSSLSLILLLGEETRSVADQIGNGRMKYFTDKKGLIDFLLGHVAKDDIVLIKGSRALGMDEIVEALI